MWVLQPKRGDSDGLPGRSSEAALVSFGDLLGLSSPGSGVTFPVGLSQKRAQKTRQALGSCVELVCSMTIYFAQSRCLVYVLLSIRKQIPLAISWSACWVVSWRWDSLLSFFISIATCWINTMSLLYYSFEYPGSCGGLLTCHFPLSPSWPDDSVLGMKACEVSSLLEHDWEVR